MTSDHLEGLYVDGQEYGHVAFGVLGDERKMPDALRTMQSLRLQKLALLAGVSPTPERSKEYAGLMRQRQLGVDEYQLRITYQRAKQKFEISPTDELAQEILELEQAIRRLQRDTRWLNGIVPY